MKGLLVRVGIDLTAGKWNAPARVASREFVYVPIPEERGESRPGLERTFKEVEPILAAFGRPLPMILKSQAMHLDPDFDHLTFGDQGTRGGQVRKLARNDFIVFYAALEPDVPLQSGDKLIYAIIGYYRIDRLVEAAEMPKELWHTNAHTRREPGPKDVIAIGQSGVSGRLKRYLPIGEYRRKSYRVTESLLDEWGGLDVKDGFIQRSAVPPLFLNPSQFLNWFEKQRPELLKSNW